MIVSLNLLPWREELRKKKQQNFIYGCVAAVILALLVVLAWMQILGMLQDNQTQRNNLLKAETRKLDAQLVEIKNLETQKKEMLEQLEIIQKLQADRHVVVHVLDELVTTLPDGVYYKSLQRKGSSISLSGRAESNNLISLLMRQLDQSDWFGTPVLTSVKRVTQGKGSGASEYYDFQLSLSETRPKDSSKAQEGGKP